MADKYHLLLKTGQAEMRAYSALTPEQKFGIAPLIEVTRGRKNHKATIAKTQEEYNFPAIYKFIMDEVAPTQQFYMDVSKEVSLSSSQTNLLRDSSHGYRNWVEFIKEIRREKPKVCPVMQINPPEGQSWDDYCREMFAQFDALSQMSGMVAYRATAKNDNSFDADLFALSDRIRSFTSAGGVFMFFLDYDYIRPGTGELHAYEASKILGVVYDIIPSASPVLVSTSFPSSVTDVAGEEIGEFSEEEVVFHKTTSRLVHNIFANLIFGDYGSINPTRNDGIVISNGWRPRIDYPFGGERIFYYREKRKSKGKGKEKEYLTSYSHHYRSVASSIVSDRRFFEDANASDFSSWGVSKIKEAAEGSVFASSPSHWISVRMNIHIQQQLRRLGLYVTPDSIFD